MAKIQGLRQRSGASHDNLADRVRDLQEQLQIALEKSS